MLIVLLVSLAVFLCRDVQILALNNFRLRFVIYALLQITGMALAAQIGHWALTIQLLELAIAISFDSWFGWVLPSPALIAALYGLGDPVVMTGAWLCLIGTCAFFLNRVHASHDDRKFVSDFALVTSCTALALLPKM
jgi:hypothetical protein